MTITPRLPNCLLATGFLILLSACDQREDDSSQRLNQGKSERIRTSGNDSSGIPQRSHDERPNVVRDLVRRAQPLAEVLRDVGKYQDKQIAVDCFWINTAEGAYISADAEESLMSSLSVTGDPELLSATGEQPESQWDFVSPFNRVIAAGTLRIGDDDMGRVDLKDHPYLELETVMLIAHDPEETLFYGSDSSTSDGRTGVTELRGHVWLRKGTVVVDGFGDPRSSIRIDQQTNRVLSTEGAVSQVRAEDYISRLLDTAQPVRPLSENPSLEVGQEVILKGFLGPGVPDRRLLTTDNTVVWEVFQSHAWHVAGEPGLRDVRQSNQFGSVTEVVVHGRIERLKNEPTLRLRTVVYLDVPNDAVNQRQDKDVETDP